MCIRDRSAIIMNYCMKSLTNNPLIEFQRLPFSFINSSFQLLFLSIPSYHFWHLSILLLHLSVCLTIIIFSFLLKYKINVIFGSVHVKSAQKDSSLSRRLILYPTFALSFVTGLNSLSVFLPIYRALSLRLPLELVFAH